MYHEQQQLYRCAVHAINNLLQRKAVTSERMDEISDEILAGTDPSLQDTSITSKVFHPLRAPLGFGNYDINVITSTLAKEGYEVKWFDKRRPIDKDTIDFESIEGILCNVIVSGWLWNGRHWFAIKQVDGHMYNLDSKLPSPKSYQDDVKCYRYLEELVASGDCELFIVRKMTLEVPT